MMIYRFDGGVQRMWYGVTFLVGAITGIIIAGINVLVGIVGFAGEIARR